MKTYTLTVFEKSGETLLDENFEAKDDERAKELGLKTLTEKGYEHKTYRCVSPDAKLLLFHR